ncbi:MAG: alanine--tRNA ligase [Endomicrobiales bacterium]|nr:alanine--tRNA ligase [Endomicrobiales bacterium]
MDSKDIRRKFLDFFKKQDHKVVPSDSLIPSGDPTLLFTSAGMVQFKNHFLGQSKDTFKRAASCQKCFRTSDIDQVGYTRRHLTFFEMLGNFSFGDYFKKDAIGWGWEFLTKTIGLPKDKLYATIYKDDEEAFKIWEKIVPKSKITRLGEDSNFWNMGPTGPCGPCSEILMDMGEKLGCGKASCGPGCDCDRYLEVWNLVFTQFDRQENGELKPLPRKNIDTGMGLERLVSASLGKETVFETDLFKPIIKEVLNIFETSGVSRDAKKSVSELRMIADHSRAITFLISDGILPSNEGRGYVLRRILRRALRQGKMFGLSEPFLYKVTAQVSEIMKDAYPELDERRENIASIVKMEEENFLVTLESGSKLLEEIIEKFGNKKTIPGQEVFKLYDTYGFPHELTKEIAGEKGLKIDEEGFIAAQKRAQEKSRAAWSGSGEKDMTLYSKIQKDVGEIKFTGYENAGVSGVDVLAIISDGKSKPSLKSNETGEIVLKQTPFYAESGGQVGDTGKLKSGSIAIDVIDTRKPVEGLVVHKVKVTKGELKVGQKIDAVVDMERRKKIMSHHTATHLLHKALRTILGTHVTQAGSLVTPDYFRFDFTHLRALEQKELQAVEEMVNKAIRDNLSVCIAHKNIEDARKQGAMALFGEKYSETVRVVSINEPSDEKHLSMELCGGTHVSKTGDIGFFKIIAESSIASGTRRIEAVVGEAAEKYVRKLERVLDDCSFKLKGSVSDLPERIDKIVTKQKEMEKEIRQLKSAVATGGGKSDILNDLKEVNGVKVLATKLSSIDIKSLRNVVDEMRTKLGSGIVILATDEDEKLSFVVSITGDLVKSGYNAGKIAKNIAAQVGGSGGGKPDFAQGGGKEVSKFSNIIKNLSEIIK